MKEFRPLTKLSSDDKIAIVVSEFNQLYTKALLDGAILAVEDAGGSEEQIEVVWVPGSYELSLASKLLLKSEEISGAVALGVLIRGDTDHYKYVADEACSGLTSIMLECEKPVGLGIIPALNISQVKERSCPVSEIKKGGDNKGYEAAKAVISMLNLKRQLAV